MSDNLKRKKEFKKELQQIEKQIYDLETTYLEETKDFGNIFTGWDAYFSKEKVKTKKTIYNEDRLFSLSSFTSPVSRREESKKNISKNGVVDSSIKPQSVRKRKKISVDESGEAMSQ